MDSAREGRIRFSVGYELTETVREAILKLPEGAWHAALEQDGAFSGRRARLRLQAGWPWAEALAAAFARLAALPVS